MRQKRVSIAMVLFVLALFCIAGVGSMMAQSSGAPAAQDDWGIQVAAPQAWHDPICAGDRQRYTLTFKNNTTMTLNDVVVADTLPDICPEGCDVCQWNDNDWPYDDCSPGATYDGQRTVSWELLTVDPGETVTLYVEVRIRNQVAPGALENCLTVDSNQIGPESACSQATVMQCATRTPSPVPTDTPTPTETPVPTVTPTETVEPLIFKLYLPDIYNNDVEFTPTPTPTTLPTITPTPGQPVVQCYQSASGAGLLYRVSPSLFRGYAGDTSSDYPLIEITSPPAPAGWNQPGFAPGSGWRAPVEVSWPAWSTLDWGLNFQAAIIGLNNSRGRPEGLDGTTHLIRQSFTLTPPEPGMHVVDSVLDMWSDNKAAWWWEGELVERDRQLSVSNHPLYPDHVGPNGGTYILAVQNSNDYMRVENPQGTAYRVCVTWAR